MKARGRDAGPAWISTTRADVGDRVGREQWRGPDAQTRQAGRQSRHLELTHVFPLPRARTSSSTMSNRNKPSGSPRGSPGTEPPPRSGTRYGRQKIQPGTQFCRTTPVTEMAALAKPGTVGGASTTIVWPDGEASPTPFSGEKRHCQQLLLGAGQIRIHEPNTRIGPQLLICAACWCYW